MNWRIKKLSEGETITTSFKGNSMLPRIASGQEVRLAPVRSLDELYLFDVVYCKVKGKYYLHNIVGKDKQKGVQIANAKGHINGWTKQVYGVVIDS